MSILTYFCEEDVRQLLNTSVGFEAVKEGFRLLGEGLATNHPRQRLTAHGTTLNAMWAIAPTEGIAGLKSYPIVRSDVTVGSAFTFLLYSLPSGRLDAILEAELLGQIRTGAASGVASQYLAREDSHVLSVFGTGYQARSQVKAIAQVLPSLRRILVVGRSSDRINDFTCDMEKETGLEIRRVGAEEAVRQADVLVTATGAKEPLFSGTWLQPGTHINAIGSNYPTKREIDKEAISQCNLVVVDAFDVARMDSGDLLLNDFDISHAIELGRIVAGKERGRQLNDDITLFESHGLALQDLMCAGAVLKAGRTSGVGRSIKVGERR